MPYTYVAAEPDAVTAFIDQSGKYHPTRDSAIQANVGIDTRRVITKLISADERLHEAPVVPLIELVWKFVLDNPGLVRVLIGDRDAT